MNKKTCIQTVLAVVFITISFIFVVNFLKSLNDVEHQFSVISEVFPEKEIIEPLFLNDVENLYCIV